jgi:hypothetical protein
MGLGDVDFGEPHFASKMADNSTNATSRTKFPSRE